MNQTTIQSVQNSLKDNLLHRVWLISDLQQSDINIARQCLTMATDDFSSLQLECDQIWYLGDSVQGKDEDILKQMVDMQIELLQQFDTPLIFTAGNHEFDPHYQLHKENDPDKKDMKVISYEKFSQTPNWLSSQNISDCYFTHKLGEYTLFFFPDHAHPRGDWITSGGAVHGHASQYPYNQAYYQAISEEIKKVNGPVITAGHSAFAGGLRPSALMNQCLPLPKNVKAHFHGHCHIGDATWGGASCLRKYATVDHQDIPQFDIAALENHRGDAVRSAVLEIYQDHTIAVYFRKHCSKHWDDLFFIN